jgi:hypothetical protein
MFGFLKRRTAVSNETASVSGYQHQLRDLMAELHQRAADVECAAERERLSTDLLRSEAELSASLREWKRLQSGR